MKQIFPFGTGESFTNTEANLLRKSVIPASGTFSSLYGKLAIDPVPGRIDLDIDFAGGGDDMSLNFENGQTTLEDTSPEAEVAGATISGSRGGNNAVSTGPCRWCLTWTGDDSAEAMLIGASNALTNDAPTTTQKYIHPMSWPEYQFGGGSWLGDATFSTTEADSRFYLPTSGTITNLTINLDANSAGSNTTTIRVVLFKNGVEETTSRVDFVATTTETTQSASGLSISFVAGDYIAVGLKDLATGTLDGSFLVRWGIVYEPTIQGESIVGGVTKATLSVTQNEGNYLPLRGARNDETDEEEMKQLIGNDCVFRKFRVNLQTAPGTNQTRIFRLRRNESDATNVITISGSSTSGVDNSNSDVLTKGDLVNLYSVTTTSGTAGTTVHWSGVLFIEPTGGVASAPVSKYNTGTNGKIIACPTENSGNTGTLDFQSITDNRTYTFPDKSGTVTTQPSSLTATRVPFTDSNGQLTDDADLTFVTDTLSVTKVASSSLTSGRVPIVSTAGLLVDDADLTFSGDTLTATKFSGAHNGTVGATTPAAGVFTSLQVDSITNDTGLAAGVYTPTRSAESNLDANVTMTEAQYLRIGNTVTVSGRFTADPTAAGAASFEITLPVASNLGAVEDVSGVAFAGGIAGQGAEIIGVVANDTAKIQWIAVDTTSQAWSFIFTYQII